MTVTISGARVMVIAKIRCPTKAGDDPAPATARMSGNPLTSTAVDTEASTVLATFHANGR